MRPLAIASKVGAGLAWLMALATKMSRLPAKSPPITIAAGRGPRLLA